MVFYKRNNEIFGGFLIFNNKLCLGFTAPCDPGNSINPEVKLATQEQLESLKVNVLPRNVTKASGKIIDFTGTFW